VARLKDREIKISWSGVEGVLRTTFLVGEGYWRTVKIMRGYWRLRDGWKLKSACPILWGMACKTIVHGWQNSNEVYNPLNVPSARLTIVGADLSNKAIPSAFGCHDPSPLRGPPGAAPSLDRHFVGGARSVVHNLVAATQAGGPYGLSGLWRWCCLINLIKYPFLWSAPICTPPTD